MFSLFFSLLLATVSSLSFAASSEDSLSESFQKTLVVSPLNDEVKVRNDSQSSNTLILRKGAPIIECFTTFANSIKKSGEFQKIQDSSPDIASLTSKLLALFLEQSNCEPTDDEMTQIVAGMNALIFPALRPEAKKTYIRTKCAAYSSDFSCGDFAGLLNTTCNDRGRQKYAA